MDSKAKPRPIFPRKSLIFTRVVVDLTRNGKITRYKDSKYTRVYKTIGLNMRDPT